MARWLLGLLVLHMWVFGLRQLAVMGTGRVARGAYNGLRPLSAFKQQPLMTRLPAMNKLLKLDT